MKNFFYNLGYFIKESNTIFRVDFLSNIFSIFSIGLIFFILSMIFSGWWVTDQVIEVLQKEAEINVYFDEGLREEEITHLIQSIGRIDGVREAGLVEEEESYNRMVEILGKESRILELFEANPFSAFIEVKIHIDKIDTVLDRLDLLDEIQHVRDNKEVINRLQKIITMLTVLGVLVITAVGISTLVVVSHIIRQGIYNNRDQINTLKLLGAPDSFIGFPFLLEGLFLTVGGGIIASSLGALILHYGYNQMGGSIPFIPLPPKEAIISSLIILTMSLSCILGVVGSLFGLSSAKAS